LYEKGLLRQSRLQIEGLTKNPIGGIILQSERGYQMKKWFSVVATVVLCLALVVGIACGGGDEDEEGVKEVKLGVGAALTGIYGKFLGIPAKRGVELAADYIGEFTVDGQRYKWNPIFEDNGWDAEGGVASATKFISEEGVNIMTQDGADAALAAQTICEQSGVILLTTDIPLDALGLDKPHTFQGTPSVFLSVVTMMKYINETYPEAKTGAGISEDTSTGYMIMEAIDIAADYYGIEWLSTEYFSPDTLEFYPMATKIAEKDPDVGYIDTRQIGAMREMGWEGVSFYGVWTTDAAGYCSWDDIQGHLVMFPHPHGEGLPEVIMEMATEYEQRFGEEFTFMSFYHIVQLYLLTDALQKAGTVDDVDQIIATLETETFDTPMGPVKFGLREVDGIGHQLMMSTWILEIRGEGRESPHRVFELSTEEAEALALEIFGK
jgi:branched-chain amino acid transport system substrate-binding protein